MGLNFETDINTALTFELMDEEVQWPKATRIYYLNQGIQEIRFLRPDSRLDEWETVDYLNYVDGQSDDLILADIFRQDIINYIVWKCYNQDATNDSHMVIAQTKERAFREGVQV